MNHWLLDCWQISLRVIVVRSWCWYGCGELAAPLRTVVATILQAALSGAALSLIAQSVGRLLELHVADVAHALSINRLDSCATLSLSWHRQVVKLLFAFCCHLWQR